MQVEIQLDRKLAAHVCPPTPHLIPHVFVHVLSLALAIAGVPGPDSTAVIANLADPDSIALSEMYRSLRTIPRAQVCALDLPIAVDMSLVDYRALLLEPFEACLRDRGVLARIEAVVLARGVPLRVAIPTAFGDVNVSLAAALSVWKSANTRDGTPLLGLTPAVRANCGGQTCFAAGWANPFRSGVFFAGWERADAQGVTHRPLLVTMLHGRSYEDAARLVISGIDGEGLSPDPAAGGTFVFMNGADPARGVRDADYDRVIAGLASRGRTNAERIAFDGELAGRTMAAFFTGTAGIGGAIENNSFLAGSIVDNLTSYGAVPENFDPGGAEVQVSIARWVAKGVAGVHGTVDEPLNNCFPVRDLLLEYVDGATLGEVFYRALPFVYWRNLVLGDVMAAPYAKRPRVAIEGIAAGERVIGAREVRVDVDPAAIESLAVYANGRELGAGASWCLTATVAGEIELLAVATSTNAMKSKGWSAVTFQYELGATECAEPDAGVVIEPDAEPAPDAIEAPRDAQVIAATDAAMTPDAGTPVAMAEEGCACSSSSRRGSGWILLLGVVVMWRRRS